MKHFCILLFFAMTAVISAADPAPAEATKPADAAKPAEAKPADAKPADSAILPAGVRPANGQPGAIPVERPSASVLTLIYQSYPEPSAYADPERAATLLNRRAELIQQIHNERKRILEEDASAKKMRDEIVLLNRKLASHIEDKRSMIELNSKLRDLDVAISRLKPAPPPPPPKTDVEDEAGKTEKTDKAAADKPEAGKTGKTDKPAASTSDKTGKTDKPASTSGSRTEKSDKPAASTSGSRAEKSDKPAASTSDKPEKTMPPPPKDDKTVKPVKE